ncbi:DUF3717 domain-containing protein [Trinickia symbiotica]|uniref:DUF3717 domain-containing protein n=1 Tax=Trinickia symbiotica TaxID=863227 RepID=UPI00037B13B4|nr:DUF3717 domain-containing protein [Trinickia symbiotica]
MKFAISDVEAAIQQWRLRSSSDEAFINSTEACALARLYGAVIVHGCETIVEAELDDAQRNALRIISNPKSERFAEFNAAQFDFAGDTTTH